MSAIVDFDSPPRIFPDLTGCQRMGTRSLWTLTTPPRATSPKNAARRSTSVPADRATTSSAQSSSLGRTATRTRTTPKATPSPGSTAPRGTPPRRTAPSSFRSSQRWPRSLGSSTKCTARCHQRRRRITCSFSPLRAAVSFLSDSALLSLPAFSPTSGWNTEDLSTQFLSVTASLHQHTHDGR